MNIINRFVMRFFPNPYGFTLSIKQRVVFEVLLGSILIIGKRLLAKNNITGRYIEIGTQALFAVYVYFFLHLFILSIAQVGFTALAVYGLIKRSQAIDGTTFYDYIILLITIFLCFFITRRYIHHQKSHRRSQLLAILCGLLGYLILAHHLPIGRLLLVAGHSILAYLYFKKNSYIFVLIQIVSVGIGIFGYLM